MDIRPHRRIMLPCNFETTLEVLDLAADLHEHVGCIQVPLSLYQSDGDLPLRFEADMGLKTFFDARLENASGFTQEVLSKVDEHDVDFVSVDTVDREKLEILAMLKDDFCKNTIMLVRVQNEEEGVRVHHAGLRGHICPPEAIAEIRRACPLDTIVSYPNENFDAAKVIELGATYIILQSVIEAEDKVKEARETAETFREFT